MSPEEKRRASREFEAKERAEADRTRKLEVK